MSDVDDGAGIADDVTVEVKGPDPAVWGDHEARLAEDVAAGKIDPPVDGVEVKGPDPDVWG